MEIYIVLYKDGLMLPLLNRPRASDHQIGAKLFKALDASRTTLSDLSGWYAVGNKATNEIKNAHFAH